MFLLIVLLVVSAFAQSGSVAIRPDLRLFTTMAALNVAGFDIEFASQYHPVREAVRKYGRDVNPDLVARLKAFYASHKENQTDEAQLAKYISLAVILTDPPEFKPAAREEQLPPDARTVLGFADLLREFYKEGRIAEHWGEVGPEYERAINQLGPALRDLIVRTDVYLHIPLGGASARNMSIYVELAAPINTVNLRSYQDNYYAVLGDSARPQIDNVRHAYLHFRLDSVVAANVSRIEGGASLLALASKSEGVDSTYTSAFRILATESLIRAIELRMDKTPAVHARETLDMYYRLGLLLAPYFYDALKSYEELGAGSLPEYFSEMARSFQYKTEQERFQATFHKIPVPQKTEARPEIPQPPPPPATNPLRDLLKEGEAAFNAGDAEKARKAFEQVLTDFDDSNGAALYGLALIASRAGDSEEAVRYFDRTVRSGSTEPSMRVWSYIFMARIFDLECNRERAVEYYQQAIKVGDNTRNAQASAREGLDKAYGDACK